MQAIDFHAHAFPDAIAERAIPALEEEGDIQAVLDGKLSSLLESMDLAGIETSVICSIATKPGQFDPILGWSLSIASERIVPLASIHPRDPRPVDRVRAVREAGLRGIKLHPYYQDFDLADESMFPLYAALEEHGLLVVCHTGFDLAFERVRRADPKRILTVLERFPDLRFVATHLGAWEDWEEAYAHLVGKPIYLETSFAVPYLDREEARRILLQHPPDRLLFGSDSPWAGQKESMDELRELGLPEAVERRLFRDNARRLLAVTAPGCGR